MRNWQTLVCVLKVKRRGWGWRKILCRMETLQFNNLWIRRLQKSVLHCKCMEVHGWSWYLGVLSYARRIQRKLWRLRPRFEKVFDRWNSPMLPSCTYVSYHTKCALIKIELSSYTSVPFIPVHIKWRSQCIIAFKNSRTSWS